MTLFRSMLSLAATLAALPALAAVEGTVVTPENTPVEGARVELAERGVFHMTDARGAFRFPDAEAPALLKVTHPRFQPLEVECCAPGGAPPLVLVPKQQVYGEIVVTANREGQRRHPAPVGRHQHDQPPATGRRR
jgi:hypothetical protein